MATQMLQTIFFIFFFAAAYTSQLSKSEDFLIPNFAFSWLDNNDTFVAGEIATIKVIVLGNYERDKYKSPFNPNITVNDKLGNSSFISGVSSYFEGGTANWRICFTPIMVGLFHVLITEVHFHVLDSSLHFHVTPGKMYLEAGITLWKGGVYEFTAGGKAEVLILPKDAFGNNVSSSSPNRSSGLYNFTLSASHANGSLANVLNASNNGWNEYGYISIEFIAVTSGNLLLHVQVENRTLQSSPLPFKVNPGKLDVSRCVIEWNIATKFFQLFSTMEAFIHQHDRFGNLVPGSYEFEVEVIEKGTNLSVPVADLSFKDVIPGIQSFSFRLEEPGNFLLVISNKEHTILISNMPYDFTVYIGYCDGNKSIINGSGLHDSLAGDVAKFTVFLNDAYMYPSPIELEKLRVQIVHESDSQILQSSIHMSETMNGRLNHGNSDSAKGAPAPILKNDSAMNWNLMASAFDVVYTPERSGIYHIRVFCGNIALNGGHSFRKEVFPGDVNMSLSGVLNYASKVQKLIKNQISIQLMDSYHNPVPLQQSKLKLEIASVNRSGFSTWPFFDNSAGTYTVSYLAKDIGTYEICASYGEQRFMPCPFGVNVYSSEYFPQVYNDTISVWQDKSIAFNVLVNDYYAGDNASIVQYSKPRHGSILQYGQFFRYTPYKGFYGNDSFMYTIADINKNLASGAVNLSVLCMPPQFVSIPIHFQATEDIVSPKFGGLSGIELMYPDLLENITVTLSSGSGTILLSPMLMQFWLPIKNGFSINKGGGDEGKLTLVGPLDVINFILQSIQYVGNENFYGEDAIHVSTINRNGQNEIDVPIYVEPINDPPFINVPPYVILDATSDEALIFGEKKPNFNFIGDPDILNFPGNKSRFLVLLSLEVSSGFLSANLPAKLIGSTELKLRTSYMWQPLQTFVTISRHFLVKAKGIRFQCTIDDSNSIMEQLIHHHDGDEYDVVLSVRVNDMGNYGCYPNCVEMMSMPLFAESRVNLIRRRPMGSLAAHVLGSAIVIESVLVFSLGMLLLFFICKCATVLIHEKRRQKTPNIELSKVQSCPKQASRTEETTQFKRSCLVPSLFRDQNSNFCRRSFHACGESDHPLELSPSPSSSSSSDDEHHL